MKLKIWLGALAVLCTILVACVLSPPAFSKTAPTQHVAVTAPVAAAKPSNAAIATCTTKALKANHLTRRRARHIRSGKTLVINGASKTLKEPSSIWRECARSLAGPTEAQLLQRRLDVANETIRAQSDQIIQLTGERDAAKTALKTAEAKLASAQFGGILLTAVVVVLFIILVVVLIRSIGQSKRPNGSVMHPIDRRQQEQKGPRPEHTARAPEFDAEATTTGIDAGLREGAAKPFASDVSQSATDGIYRGVVTQEAPAVEPARTGPLHFRSDEAAQARTRRSGAPANVGKRAPLMLYGN